MQLTKQQVHVEALGRLQELIGNLEQGLKSARDIQESGRILNKALYVQLDWRLERVESGRREYLEMCKRLNG